MSENSGSGLEDISLRHKQLTGRVRDVVREAILAGCFRLGDRLTQEKLAAQLGVSRTPIREALYLLEREGLVRLIPRKGAIVGGFDERDVVEIYEVRELLEPHAAVRACEIASPEDIDGLRNVQAMMERLPAKETAEGYRLNGEFHQRLCRPSNNGLLITILANIWTQQRALYMFPYQVQSPDALRDMHAEHREILEAYVARDTDRAGQLVREHIVRARDGLLRHLTSVQDFVGSRAPRRRGLPSGTHTRRIEQGGRGQS
jgi:DNA-binding GntR family transcriptional regulator